MAEYRYRDEYRGREGGGRYRDEERGGFRDDDRGGRYRDEDRGGRHRDDGRGMFGFGRSHHRDDDRDRRDDPRARAPHHDDDRGGGRGREHPRSQERERGYGSDDHHRGLPMDETSHLIASNKVEGTAVYGSDGRRLGSIHNFMVDKLTGKVEYAVMTYGTGFLGMGARYYPLPWRMLNYDTRAGGYRIEMVERDLQDAPSFDRDSEPRFDRRYGQGVHDYYGLNY